MSTGGLLPEAELKDDGNNPADYVKLASGKALDLSCAAARLLKHLDRFESHMSRLHRSASTASLWPTVQKALITATYVHQLTLVESEKGINAWIRQKAYSKNTRVGKNVERNIQMATQFREKQGKTGMSDTKLKEEIGKKHNLKRRASHDAVNDGLRRI